MGFGDAPMDIAEPPMAFGELPTSFGEAPIGFGEQPGKLPAALCLCGRISALPDCLPTSPCRSQAMVLCHIRPLTHARSDAEAFRPGSKEERAYPTIPPD